MLLDGRPLGDYDKRWRHRVVSMVGQEPVLFARSIRENIQYGMEEEDVSFDRYRCGWAWGVGVAVDGALAGLVVGACGGVRPWWPAWGRGGGRRTQPGPLSGVPHI